MVEPISDAPAVAPIHDVILALHEERSPSVIKAGDDVTDWSYPAESILGLIARIRSLEAERDSLKALAEEASVWKDKAIRLEGELREWRNAGWIPWAGGDCPVQPDTRVTIRVRDGEQETGRGKDFDWHHVTGREVWEVTAYSITRTVALPSDTPSPSDAS